MKRKLTQVESDYQGQLARQRQNLLAEGPVSSAVQKQVPSDN